VTGRLVPISQEQRDVLEAIRVSQTACDLAAAFDSAPEPEAWRMCDTCARVFADVGPDQVLYAHDCRGPASLVYIVPIIEEARRG
jgi:hypothetical protein